MYHNFITPHPSFKSLPHLIFSIVLLHISSIPLSQSTSSLSLSPSESQGHATQIDCGLIANVMMLQSTHLTCLINTTAATPVHFSLMLSHTSTSMHTNMHRITGGSTYEFIACIVFLYLLTTASPLTATPTPTPHQRSLPSS